eukprot:EG_transcript_493
MDRRASRPATPRLLEAVLRGFGCAVDAELLANLLPLDADRLPGLCHEGPVQCVFLPVLGRPGLPPRLHLQLPSDAATLQALAAEPPAALLRDVHDQAPAAGAMLQVSRTLVAHLLARANARVPVPAAEDVAQSSCPESLTLVLDMLEPEGFEFPRILEGVRAFCVAYPAGQPPTLEIAADVLEHLTGKLERPSENGRVVHVPSLQNHAAALSTVVPPTANPHLRTNGNDGDSYTTALPSYTTAPPSSPLPPKGDGESEASEWTLLNTIVHLMEQHKNRTMGYKELSDALQWPERYSRLGNITDFAARHPRLFQPKCGCMTLRWDAVLPPPDELCPTAEVVAPTGTASATAPHDALAALIAHLQADPTKPPLLTELASPVAWEPEWGDVAAFVKAHPEWFGLYRGRLSVTPAALKALDLSDPQRSGPQPESAALDAIVVALADRPRNEAGVWELIQLIHWDKEYGHLGKLSDFAAQHPHLLHCRHNIIALAQRGSLASQGIDSEEVEWARAALAEHLSKRDPPRLPYGDLVRAMDWDRHFPATKLRDFCERHSDVFDCTPALVSLRANGVAVAGGAVRPPLRILARDVIVQTLLQQPQHEMDARDLAEQLAWPDAFGELGDLPAFLAENGHVFETHRHKVVLRPRSRPAEKGREEQEALNAIASHLLSRTRNPRRGHCAGLVRQVDWDNAFPRCGKLLDFCQAHPDWFEVRHSFIALRRTAPYKPLQEGGPFEGEDEDEEVPEEDLPGEKDALYAMAAQLAATPAGELAYWDLAAALDWERQYGHLGSLTQLAEDSGWFEMKALTLRLLPSGAAPDADLVGPTGDLRVEAEVVLRIAAHIRDSSAGELHTTRLFALLGWDACFQTVHPLLDVLQRHQNWFRVRNGFVAVTPHGERGTQTPAASLMEQFALEESALKALIGVLSREPGHAMPPKQLVEQVLWEHVFAAELGPLQQFVEQWPDCFDLHRHQVALRPNVVHTPRSSSCEAPSAGGPPTQGEVEEALQAIVGELVGRHAAGRHLTPLLKALDWDARFPAVGRLSEFVERHPDWFDLRNGVVFLRNAHETIESGGEDEALEAITNAIRQRPGLMMGIWELVNEIRWDTSFPDLGKLSVFLERYPEHFAICRGWVSLQPTAPPLSPGLPAAGRADYIDWESEAGAALRAIAGELRNRQPPKMHREEVLKAVDWDRAFPRLGKLSDFTEAHWTWFRIKGGFIVLKEDAPLHLLDQPSPPPSSPKAEPIAHSFPTLDALIQTAARPPAPPGPPLSAMQTVDDLEAEVEALTVLTDLLGSRRPPAAHMGELQTLLDWKVRYGPRLGLLASFVARQTQRLEVRDGFVSLVAPPAKAAAPTLSPPPPIPIPPNVELSDREVHALYDVVKGLSARRGSKMWVWDLMTDLNWDQVAGQLGPLPDFLRTHHRWFHLQTNGLVSMRGDGPPLPPR